MRFGFTYSVIIYRSTDLQVNDIKCCLPRRYLDIIEYILINQSLPFCRILVDIYSHLSQVISDGEMESSANSDKYQLVLTQTYLISSWLL